MNDFNERPKINKTFVNALAFAIVFLSGTYTVGKIRNQSISATSTKNPKTAESVPAPTTKWLSFADAKTGISFDYPEYLESSIAKLKQADGLQIGNNKIDMPIDGDNKANSARLTVWLNQASDQDVAPHIRYSFIPDNAAFRLEKRVLSQADPSQSFESIEAKIAGDDRNFVTISFDKKNASRDYAGDFERIVESVRLPAQKNDSMIIP